MRDQSCEDNVFNKLDSLREKYERAERIRNSIQNQIKNCYSDLDWQNDKNLIEKLIEHLPKCYLSFLMYSQLFLLQEAETNKVNDNSGMVSPQKDGDDNV